jgi:hypothetical protein
MQSMGSDQTRSVDELSTRSPREPTPTEFVRSASRRKVARDSFMSARSFKISSCEKRQEMDGWLFGMYLLIFDFFEEDDVKARFLVTIA